MQTPSQVALFQSPSKTSLVPSPSTGASKGPEPAVLVSAARKNVVYFTNWYVCAIALTALHCLGGIAI
jgi:hypothetical protein